MKDLSWQAPWNRSAQLFLTFCEDMIYGDAYDASLRAAARGNKGPANTMEIEAIQLQFEKIKAMRDEEKKKDNAGTVCWASPKTLENEFRRPLPEKIVKI